MLVVLHMSPHGPSQLPRVLRRAGVVEVAETIDGAAIELGKIYVAPPDSHLLVDGRRLRLSRGPKENRTRPAIDPLFRTAAMAYGARVVGVILTGMLDDGTAGLFAVKERGGISVVQDPKDALYPSMPESALQYVEADYTVPVAEIAPLLARLAKQPVEHVERSPMSALVETESRFSNMEVVDMQDMDAIGSVAGMSCPECQGPLWKIKEPKPTRYRCHVGHAFTRRSMAASQVEAEETHLWQALRTMKERAALISEAQSHEGQSHDPKADRPSNPILRQLETNIALIQEMLRGARPQ
jgi:two-component system chemotaxis response regulator CheB